MLAWNCQIFTLIFSLSAWFLVKKKKKVDIFVLRPLFVRLSQNKKKPQKKPKHFISQHSSSVGFFWVCQSVHHSVDLPVEHITERHVNIHQTCFICVSENNHYVMTHQDRESPGTLWVAPLGWLHLHLSPCSDHLEVKSHSCFKSHGLFSVRTSPYFSFYCTNLKDIVWVTGRY